MSTPWPHQFTRKGRDYIGPHGQLLQPMICVHCYQEYMEGDESRPPDPCPARNDKRELKRIKR